MNQNSVEKAAQLFKVGYNCSQSVLAAHANELGLPEDLALRLATPFGGGMGRRGEVCGAVSGALMVLGLKAGNTDPQDKTAKERAYALACEFQERFQARHGAILCRELLGYDIGSPEALALARAEGRFTKRCPNFVRDAAAILDEMLV
jgi:C_GCAxxG_C_C family probable redox protein